MKQQTKITPVGTAMYPYLRKPDTYQGQDVGYKLNLILTDAELAQFVRGCQTAIDEAKNDPRYANKSWVNATNPVGEDKNGEKFVKFKSSSVIKTRQGDVKRVIPVYDCDGTIIPPDIDIGNGSRVRVAYMLQPYWMSSRVCGIAARIVAVQVVDLVEPGMSAPDASAFGFGCLAGSCHADDIKAQAQGFGALGDGDPVDF